MASVLVPKNMEVKVKSEPSELVVNGEDKEALEATLRRQELQSILNKEMSSLAKLLQAAGAPVLKLELQVHLALDTDAGTSIYNVLLEKDLHSKANPSKACDEQQEQPLRNRKRKSSMPMKFGAKQVTVKCSTLSNESKKNCEEQQALPTVVTSSHFPGLYTIPGTSFTMVLDSSAWNNSLQSTSLTLTPMSSPNKISTCNDHGSVTVSSTKNGNNHNHLTNNNNNYLYPVFNGNNKGKLPLRPLRASFSVTESVVARNKQPLSIVKKEDGETTVCDELAKSITSPKPSHGTSKQRKISRRFTCQQCQEVFPALNSLTKHTLAVHGRFRCSECGEAFTQKSNMERHFLKHQNFKPFRCGICNKAYYRKDHAARHVETSHIGHDSRLVVEKIDELGNRHAAPSITSIRLPAGYGPENHFSSVMCDEPVVLTGEAAEAAAAAELAATAAAAELIGKDKDAKLNISDAVSETRSTCAINLSFGH